MNPTVSVIVVTYNQAPVLRALLGSLAAQGGTISHEVIVCDDGSADDSLAVVSEWQKTHDVDVRYVWQPDCGFRAARSRNNGIRLARGEILVFIDGDSLLKPFFLRAHVDSHRTDARVVYGGRAHLAVRENADLTDWRALLALEPEQDDLAANRDWLAGKRPWMACVSANLSVRRVHCLLFDERFEGWGSEDRDYVYRLWKGGLTVHLLDRSTAVQPVRRHERIPWNPFRGGGHESVDALLRNKLHLFEKYPGELMAPSLELVRFCYLDRDTDRWQIGRRRADVPVREILEEYVAWSTSCRRAQPA